MANQVIATKLYVPQLRRDLVARPRLVQRLERATEARLTLVSAPAGFGKTTLVAAWLTAKPAGPRAVVWLSLDPADKDPAAFWTYVATALHEAVPNVTAAALDLLASAPSASDPVLTTLLNELAVAPEQVWLVLDDYHLADNNPEIRDGMAFLLEHLPVHVHVVLITRADPDLPLARWRVRRELVEVRAADLRFTPDEAAAYLNAVPDVHLEPAHVAVLADRTEGWIAALQLAALSLQGREDVSIFVDEFAGGDRYVVDYLVDEVLRHQPDAVRAFLVQSAVLDRMTGSLCDAVTGGHDGHDMLVALERANLFLVALDDHRGWYRYHHLFADVLRSRLLSEQPDQVLVLHQRASRWYESQHLTEQAVEHALAGQDFERASRMMELAMPAVRRHRQDALMYRWLKLLPDDVIYRSPVLSVFHGSMLMVSGDLNAAESRLDDASRVLAAALVGEATAGAETEELRTLPATIRIYRAWLAQARGDTAAMAEHARNALELAGPDDHLARGGAAGFVGLAAWAAGDVSNALASFTEVVASLHAAGNVVDELSSTVVLADLWLVAGQPSKARRLYEQALAFSEARDVPSRAAAELHIGLGELDVEVADLDRAKEHFDTAAALADRTTTTENDYRGFIARALLARADGHLEHAVEFLIQAQQQYRPTFFPDVRPIPALTARVWIAQGQLSQAADWARDHGVAVTDDASYHREFDHLTLVRLLFAQHRAHPKRGTTDGAIGLLARLHRAATDAGRLGSLVEIGMLQALAQDAQGDRPGARELLAETLAVAPDPDGYVRLFLDEGAPMLTLLRDMAQHGVAHHHPERLLARTAASGTQPTRGGRQRAAAPTGSLSERELQVLRLLDSDLTGPQIARELFVSRNTLRSHTKHIFTKLDVTSRRSAVYRARERGLI